MSELLRPLKKELIFLILIKAFFVFFTTILEPYEIALSNFIAPILNLFILLIIPLILLWILYKKNIEFTFKDFILLGIIITTISSLIRVFVFNKYILKLIYDNPIYDSSISIIDTMSFLQRTQEFVKFTLIGTFFFVIVGIFKLVKR